MDSIFYSTLLWHGGALLAMVWFCVSAVKAKSKLFIAWEVLLPLALDVPLGQRWRLIKALKHFEKTLGIGERQLKLVCPDTVPPHQWPLALGALWQAHQGHWTPQNQTLRGRPSGALGYYEWQEENGQWLWTYKSTHSS